MTKISKISPKTVADLFKQKKLEKIKIAKEKETEIQAAKDLKFDEFVKNTAKNMLKVSPKYQLQVFDTNILPKLPTFSSEQSVWAPWSKLSGN